MSQLTVVKEYKNGAMMKDAKGEVYFRVDKIRASYPFVGTPSKDEGEDGSERSNWRIVGMLPKATHTEIKDAMKQHILQLQKDNDAKVPADKWYLKNGDDSEDEAMHGHFLLSAADSKKRPKVRDRKGQVMDDIQKIDDTFYGGCWVSLLIRPWFFNGTARSSTKKFPKRVSANLVGVMFYKDDTPFGSGRIDDDGAWGDTASDEDDGMDDGDDGL